MAAHRKVKVPWQMKAMAFNVFDRMPLGEQLYYAFQKYITKTQPRSYVPTSKSGQAQIQHARRIVSVFENISEIRLLEIGAGWDLYANLIYWCYGVDHQYAVDIRRWARAETVNAAIRHLANDPPPDSVRKPSAFVSSGGQFHDSLRQLYGITYLAPMDAAATDIDPASIDFIATTSVFEHIPAAVIPGIVKEFRRVIRSLGMMSHTIDYSDHYCHADSKINEFNYLKFGQNEWKKFNPGIHYQNRLRTRDFVSMFKQAGFEIIEADEWFGRDQDLELTPVNPDFSGYRPAELLALGCHLLAKPAPLT